MVVREILSAQLVPLYPQQRVADALANMQLFHVRELPVVAEERAEYLGIAEESTLQQLSPSTLIATIPLGAQKPVIEAHAHVLEVLRIYQENKMSILPVVDENGRYLGTVTSDTLLEGLARMMNVHEPGALLHLQLATHDYMLSDIARLAEMNDVLILDVYTLYDSMHDIVNVFIKTNRMDISSFVATLSRYHYQLVQIFAPESSINSLRDNYDMLMNYINM